MAGLGQGILDEGAEGFLGFGHVKLALGAHVQSDVAQETGEFLQFAGVVGRHHDLLLGLHVWS